MKRTFKKHLAVKTKQYRFKFNWLILNFYISYTGGSKKHNLCLEEKVGILTEKSKSLLNRLIA